MTAPESGRWYTDEINALIKIWGDAKIQNMFDGTVRDAEVYKLISKTLLSQGFNRSLNQVKTKIKSLKRDYRKTIDDLNASESGGKIKFIHFDTMNKVLGENTVYQPVFNSESSLPNDEIVFNSESSLPNDEIVFNSELSLPNDEINSCENSITDEIKDNIVDKIKKELSPSHSESEDISLPNEIEMEAPRTHTTETAKITEETPQKQKKASIKEFITTIASAVDKFISVEKEIEERNFEQNKKFQEQLLEIEKEKLNLLKKYVKKK